MNINKAITVIASESQIDGSILYGMLDSIYDFTSSHKFRRMLDTVPTTLIVGSLGKHHDLIPKELLKHILFLEKITIDQFQQFLTENSEMIRYIFQAEDILVEEDSKFITGRAMEITNQLRWISKYCIDNNCSFIKLAKCQRSRLNTNPLQQKILGSISIPAMANTIYLAEMKRNKDHSTDDLVLTNQKSRTQQDLKIVVLKIPKC